MQPQRTQTADDGSRAPIGVVGATGQQGGAVVDALVAGGHPVRAIVRDPDGERGRALAARGVEVVAGDLDEPGGLGAAFGGLSSLFLMTTYDDPDGTAGEVRRGVAVAEAAARAGVPRVVYSSVGGAERRTGIPHFDSKFEVEERLRSLLPTTVVRPVFFMENLGSQLDGAGDGDEFVLRLPMPGDVPVQLVAVRDIGAVAAAALVDPAVLGGEALEIAGDELTADAVAAQIGEFLDRPARYEALPLDVLGDDEDRKAMFRWFVDTPAYAADFARTRAVDPGVLDLRAWLAAR